MMKEFSEVKRPLISIYEIFKVYIKYIIFQVKIFKIFYNTKLNKILNVKLYQT